MNRIDALRLFSRLADRGSFSAAAKDLSIKQSTASKWIAALEEGVGVRLVDRTTRSVRLTDEGRRLLARSRELLAAFDELEAEFEDANPEPRGRFRISVPVVFGRLFVVPALATFLRRFPKVSTEVVMSDRYVNLVEEGFDVAIRAGKLADSSLVARSLGFMQSYAVASPGFLKRNGTPKVPADLEKLECVIFGASPDRNTWTLQSASGEARVSVQGRVVVNDFDILHECALDSLGVAILPVHRCADDLREKRLRRVLADWCTREVQMHAVYASTRHVSPAIKAFLDHVQREMEHGPWTKVSRARALAGS